MSEINITIPVGTTKRLLTAGKYCPNDILVTAEGSSSRLPEGYTELEYIQSTGAQYVNTGFNPTGSTRVVTDFDLMTGSAGWPTLFGAWTGSGNAMFGVMQVKSTAKTLFAYNTANTTLSVNIPGRHLVEVDKGQFLVDGTEIESRATASFTASNPLILFDFGGVETSGTNRAVGKLYSCQIYDNDVLVRDYAPCRNPYGVVGLYDKVNGQFYGNAGTGVFVGGAPAVEVELPFGYTKLDYIQSSGTQYIDTGVQLTASELAQFKFTVETAFLSNSPAIHGEGNTFVGFYNSGYPFTACIAGSSSQNTAYAYDTAWHTMVLDAIGKQASIDGVSHTVNVGTKDMVATFQLFGWNYSNGHHPNSSRIRSARLELGGVALRDYVPCRRDSDGVCGLYDLVNAKFYGNAGSGSFTGA